jgi:hypothetical protein
MALGRMLIVAGLVLIAAGLLTILVGRFGIPLGRLPGDIRIEGRHGSFYFPLTTCVLLSALVSAIVWLLRR